MGAADSRSHAEAIHQLQQQALQASTEAGVQLQDISQQQPSPPQRLSKASDSKQQALSKLLQLQADAEQHAAQLKVRCHACCQLSAAACCVWELSAAAWLCMSA